MLATVNLRESKEYLCIVYIDLQNVFFKYIRPIREKVKSKLVVKPHGIRKCKSRVNWCCNQLSVALRVLLYIKFKMVTESLRTREVLGVKLSN